MAGTFNSIVDVTFRDVTPKFFLFYLRVQRVEWFKSFCCFCLSDKPHYFSLLIVFPCSGFVQLNIIIYIYIYNTTINIQGSSKAETAFFPRPPCTCMCVLVCIYAFRFGKWGKQLNGRLKGQNFLSARSANLS